MLLPKLKKSQGDPLQQLPATAATEIVKAARASLKEPTRPVTPADAGRRLLQSDCYSNRPQTAGGQLSSRAFLSSTDSAAGLSSSSTDDTLPTVPWGLNSNCGSADVWTADVDTPGRSSSTGGSTYADSGSSKADGDSVKGLPDVRPGVLRPGSALRPSSALLHSSAVRPCTAGRLSAVNHLSLSSPPSALGTSPAGLVGHSTGAHHSTAAQGFAAESIAAAWPSSAAEDCSTDSTAAVAGDLARPCAEASFSSISSQGSSRGASRDSSRAASTSSQQPCTHRSCRTAAADPDTIWQQQVLQAVQTLNSSLITPSTADATALLQACAALQSLLDTAEDQQELQERLDASPQESALTASNGAAVVPANGTARPAAGKRLRAVVLNCLVRLVDCPKQDVLVKVGSMMLRAIPLQSSMMVTAAKMLYKLSKDSSNDARFRHHGVLRPLLSVTAASSKADYLTSSTQQQQQQQQPLGLVSSGALQNTKQQDGTVLLYLAGCLKNLSADAANQKTLGRLGAVQIMAQVLVEQVQRHPQLQQQQAQQQQPHPALENAAQVCVQVTAVLRNLAVVQSHSQLFAEQQGLPIAVLLDLLIVQQHEEVVLNVSRCLSKLSLHSQCRDCILQWQPRCSTIGVQCTCSNLCNRSGSLAVCLQHCDTAVALLTQLTLRPASGASHRAVILRLAFVLANLTTLHPEARQQVATVPGALDSLLQLMHDFLHELLKQQEQQHASLHRATTGCTSRSNGGSRSSSPPFEDILTKLLRLLGNVAITSVIGLQLAADQSAVDVVMGVLCSCSYESQEELVLNAAAALTNLAFYNQPGNKFLVANPVTLLQSLLPLLTSSNEEAATEAARAISNIARGSLAAQQELLHHHQYNSGDSVYEELSPDNYRNSTSDDTVDTGGQESVGSYVLQALVLLLGHSSWEVIGSAAGALVNLSAVPGSAVALWKAGIEAELADSLQRGLAELQPYCTAGSQQPSAAAAAVLDAMEVLLQCSFNMKSNNPQLHSEASAAGKGQSLSVQVSGSSSSSGVLRAAEDSIPHHLQQVIDDLSAALRSEAVLVPRSLVQLLAAVQSVGAHVAGCSTIQ